MKLASWNLRNLSRKRSSACVERLAEIFKKFDLLAIQEVRDEDIIRTICDVCGYSYVLSPPLGDTRKEFYAFVYNDRVACGSHAVLEAGTAFVRDPFMGFFRCGFDFVLVSIHVVWGKLADRREEVSHLGPVLQTVFAKSGTEKDIILCGDFNTCPGKFHSMGPWRDLSSLRPIVGGTTINQTGARTANMYDNIWISSHTKEFDDGGVLEIDNLKELSDHFPVWMSFRNEDDDEGDVDLRGWVYNSKLI